MNAQEYKIKGWVAREQNVGEDGTNLYLWGNYGDFIGLPKDMFQSLSYNDEPIEVELTIKKI